MSTETRDEFRARVRGELERFAEEDKCGHCAMVYPPPPPGAMFCSFSSHCPGLVAVSDELLDELEAEEREEVQG